ncbi:MAG TPA: phytanoyl-CoA dioxygenase family protein [Bacteroidia bacterium]|nr:phytanoyl-CoA dioxygenase family protein [Bacteroidia bacterium]
MINQKGFQIIENIYSAEEINRIIDKINRTGTATNNFRKSSELYAIRNFLNEIPEIQMLVFNQNLKSLVAGFGLGYLPVKSIYFDKPPQSNWFVAWHQDITISVNEKANADGYSNWVPKNGYYSVNPPVEVLENLVTVRIHLDDTTAGNGALHVLPASHLEGIKRVEKVDAGNRYICEVKGGGVMLMKPLLFHSSARTANNERRRVIHIEFSNMELPGRLKWAERTI